MKRIWNPLLLAITCVALLVSGCKDMAIDVGQQNGDGDTDSVVPVEDLVRPLYDGEDPDSKEDVDYVYNGVDVLLIVDNSGSMAEEQAMLSTAVYSFVSALANPLPGWAYPPVENVQLAVVSADMGLQYGPQGAIPTDVTLTRCGGTGDDAVASANNFEAFMVIEETILCDTNTALQCPEGWTCDLVDDSDIGRCSAPFTNEIDCDAVVESAFPSIELGGDGRETFATEVACLANLGTDGCGIEQQLAASVQGLEHNKEFLVRDDALLAIFVVTDEEDCSIADSELFDTPEFSNDSLRKINVACDLYPEFLTSVKQIKESYIEAKGGDSQAVIFGSLAGVPIGEDCEGGGHRIGQCLEHPDMEKVIEEDPASAQKVMRPACDRRADSHLVTQARPGHRFVELAEEFGEYGYVYSICNDDYSGIMEDFAKQIMRAMQHNDPTPSQNDLDADPDNGDTDTQVSCSVSPALGASSHVPATLMLLVLAVFLRRRLRKD